MAFVSSGNLCRGAIRAPRRALYLPQADYCIAGTGGLAQARRSRARRAAPAPRIGEHKQF
jgi:hypothetical protein